MWWGFDGAVIRTSAFHLWDRGFDSRYGLMWKEWVNALPKVYTELWQQNQKTFSSKSMFYIIHIDCIFESPRWKFRALIYCCHLTSSWCYLDCWQPIDIRRGFLGKIKKVCFRLFSANSVSMQYSIYLILNHVNEVDFISVCVTLFYIISKLHILIAAYIIDWYDDFTFGCYPIRNYIYELF